MNDIKKILIVVVVIGAISALSWTANNVQTYYQIYSDTVQVKKSVAPIAGNTLQAIDTFGDYVTLPMFGVPVKDSATAYLGTKFTLVLNTAYRITATSGFTSIGRDTLVFPAGITGNWIAVNFDIKDSIIVYLGTNVGLCVPSTATAGTSKIYYNINGNW